MRTKTIHFIKPNCMVRHFGEVSHIKEKSRSKKRKAGHMPALSENEYVASLTSLFMADGALHIRWPLRGLVLFTYLRVAAGTVPVHCLLIRERDDGCTRFVFYGRDRRN